MTEYVVNYATGGTITKEQAEEIGRVLDALDRCMTPNKEEFMRRFKEEIMETDYREFELVTLAGQFTVLINVDDDELHTLLYNEDGLAMFTTYDWKPLLVRGDSILALWEI